MSFLSFNYWHEGKKVWVPCTWNQDRIERIEPDPDNADRTYVWLIGQDYPPLWTDMAWTTAATTFGAAPPPAAPTVAGGAV
jgi:hypothetical protein